MSPSRPDPRDVLYIRVGNGRPSPVLFWEDPRGVYVIASGSATRWAHESLRDGGCTVARIDGRSDACSVELVDDPEIAGRARAGVREKYGNEVYDEHFGPRSKVLFLRPGGDVVPRSPDQLLRQEFDAVAATYTEAVQSDPIERSLKETTRDRLLRLFPSRERLLEIGAGTGFETLPLLAGGHPIDVVDISPRMLESLAARAASAELGARLTCRNGRLGRLQEPLGQVRAGEFDGAYSTFGAFNLEDDLGGARDELARVLRPGARLAFTSLNRPGALPVLWELMLGNGAGALGRAQRRIPAGTIRSPLTIYPRNPSWWDEALRPYFRRVKAAPVSVLAPPFRSPRLVRWLGSSGGRRVRRWDAWLSRTSALTPFGEWSFLVYERVGGPPPSRLGNGS
jgi:SAM-dependent methyltransferase